MIFYEVFDFILESNVKLHELTAAERKESNRTYRLHAARTQATDTNYWFRRVQLPDGREWLGLAKQRQGFLLRFPNLADFSVSDDGTEIDCYPNTGIDLGTLSHLLLDQVIPMILSQRGELVLHASAVASRMGAIAFLGDAGLGKSTLSASFCQQGFPLLTDDCLLLKRDGREFSIIPSYPGLRLWPETQVALEWDSFDLIPVAHYTDKRRIKLDSGQLPFCTIPVPVNRIYVLVPPNEGVGDEFVLIHPMKPREAFLELVHSSFRLDTSDRKGNMGAFERIDEFVSAITLFQLSFPRDLSFLPSVRKAVMEHIAGNN